MDEVTGREEASKTPALASSTKGTEFRITRVGQV